MIGSKEENSKWNISLIYWFDDTFFKCFLGMWTLKPRIFFLIKSKSKSYSNILFFFTVAKLTCFSRSLTYCNRNQLNPTTLLWENVQNVPKYWDILAFAKISEIGPHFGCFLKAGWSDSVCIVSGIFRYKSRVPRTYYSDNV